ncbi:hypothetical protein Q4F19_15740 [Sphingomonas sp. BIUV-7]|uniref:Uncharacterized protein n=1 Tax=Sphingomonas natans TaxID=3063330 RepID=A0ABT8YDI3_9SPHN|nr:hypothetical protein [Sphingomonas sp. BIUV-7]MDO6415843.1 hypothetical protein [Sphingomonas sp. BIUV-7]
MSVPLDMVLPLYCEAEGTPFTRSSLLQHAGGAEVAGQRVRNMTRPRGKIDETCAVQAAGNRPG